MAPLLPSQLHMLGTLLQSIAHALAASLQRRVYGQVNTLTDFITI